MNKRETGRGRLPVNPRALAILNKSLSMQAMAGCVLLSCPLRNHAHFPTYRLASNMQIPEWTKPALMGAAVGAIALAVVGFNWSGWVTSASASEMSGKQSMAAVAAALTPYCIHNAKSDPKSGDIMAEIEKASTYQRRGIVEKAGWATPLGAEKPDRALAESCQIALTKDN